MMYTIAVTTKFMEMMGIKKIGLEALVFLILLLPACTQATVSTDLTDISVSNIQLAEKLADIDTSIFTPSDRYTATGCTVAFEELRIYAGDGIISRLEANVEETDIVINGVVCTTLDNVESVLGIEYREAWFDREQYLKEHIYTDTNNNIKASFIYNEADKSLIWLHWGQM